MRRGNNGGYFIVNMIYEVDDLWGLGGFFCSYVCIDSGLLVSSEVNVG